MQVGGPRPFDPGGWDRYPDRHAVGRHRSTRSAATHEEATIEDRLFTNPPRTADGILDAARLTPGEIMDALYNSLWSAAYGPHPELQPDLDRFGEFFVDFPWMYKDQPVPTPRLVRAMDALLRLRAAGEGWGTPAARGYLADALDELEAWADSLR